MAKAVEKYHRIECPLMEYLVSLEPEDQHVHYILRLLCFLSHQVYFFYLSQNDYRHFIKIANFYSNFKFNFRVEILKN